MVFENPFFSWKGQKERFGNVLAVFNPFEKRTIVLPSGSPAPLINHPLTKAALLTAGAAAAAPTVVVPILGGAVGFAAKTFTQLSPLGKVGVIVSAPVAAGILKESP